MLRIIGRITPRSGAVDTDPCQVIFWWCVFSCDPSKEKYHGQKNYTPFSRMDAPISAQSYQFGFCSICTEHCKGV